MSPRCVMNINLQKGYNLIELSFIRDIPTSQGLSFKFPKWVMVCKVFVSYFLVINSSLTEPFQGKTGIIHGDPMSPNHFSLPWSICKECCL